MGCVSSKEAESPMAKTAPHSEKTKEKPVQNSFEVGRHGENKNLLHAHAVEGEHQVASNGSGRPGWDVGNKQNNHLQPPANPININQSPVDIFISPQQQDMYDIKHMAYIQSKQVLLSHTPKKFSVIEQNSQENAASNEINKLQGKVDETKEQLRDINNRIKENSGVLQEKLREDEIQVEEVVGFKVPGDDRMGDELHVGVFGLYLPLLQIRPQLQQAA